MTATHTPPLPNFLIAGATRSGTTFLHKALECHPDIFVPDPKELWFFNVDSAFRQGIDHYRQMFDGWDGEAAVGEATPLYFTDGLLYRDRKTPYTTEGDSAMSRIARSLPNIRIILSLRHPRARMVSQYRKNRNQGKPGVESTLEEHIRATAGTKNRMDFVHMNRYEYHLPAVLEAVGAERVRIVILEEWANAPQEIVKELFHFLGVDPAVDTSLPDVRNDATAYVSRRSRFARYIPGLFGLSRRDHDSTPFELHPETEAWLEDRFAPGIQAVEDHLGRPIESWGPRASGRTD